MIQHYKLVGHEPTACTQQEWDAWHRTADRKVAVTRRKKVCVSTIFLSYAEHPTQFFETAVFGGPHEGLEQHYSTWAAAVAGHDEVCELVFGKGK